MMGTQDIRIDIIESGTTINAARMLGIVPESHELDDFTLYVNTIGSTVVVRRSDTDDNIVSAVGFSKAMQKLADHYNMPVTVAADPGVNVTGKMKAWLGTWQPSNPVVSRGLAVQDDNGNRVMVKVGCLVAAKDAENSPVYVIEAFTGSDTIVRDVATGLRARIADIRYVVPGYLTIMAPVTLPAPATPVADGCKAGFRHEPSYRFVISSHNGIDFGTCNCGELIQGNRADGYRLRADVIAEKARERAAKVEAGFPAVGDWLHHDPSGTTGRVTLINSAGRLTVDFGDGRPRSAHWDVLEGEGFELIKSSPAADELMTYGQAETPGRDSVPAPVYGSERVEQVKTYLTDCGEDASAWPVDAMADRIGREFGPVGIDAVPDARWSALLMEFAPVALVGRPVRGKAHRARRGELSKPNATKVNRRKRKSTKASRARTGGKR